jgi:putative addiction module component (TIGR02574 family)
MPEAYEEVANAALALPPEARAMLVDDLVASLSSASDEVDSAWRAEIERRVKEIEDGRAQLIPGEQVMRELHAQLKQ